MYCSRAGLLACVFLSIAHIACQKKALGPPPRYAVLRFENISGDPSLDWTGRAASETLSVSLAGAIDGPVLPPVALGKLEQSLGARPASAPGISSERQEAVFAGATRLIEGYIERAGGRIRITASVEDLSSGKSLRTVSVVVSSPLAALDGIARQFSPHPKPAPTSSVAAMRLYSLALESPIAAGTADLAEVTREDPSFGPAWTVLVSLYVARGDRAAAADAADRAHRQKLDPLSLARLDLEVANLQPDLAPKVEALRKIAALSPAETGLLRDLANVEAAAGSFAAAAADWKKLTVSLPADPSVWNSLGYTLSYAGDYQGAKSALQEYERILPKDPNVYDSLGDLNYSFRRFKEAADNYQQASRLQPDFERYGDLYKGAWAKWNSGDKSGADALFSQFRAAREKLADGVIPLVAADWLYRTGRRREAFQSLRATVSGAVPPPGNEAALRANGYALLTIWDLIGHDRAQAAKDSLATGLSVTDGPILMARFAALPSASAAEWEARADRMIAASAPGLRELALGYALVFDDQRAAALTVWAKIVKDRSATDFFVRAVDARLQGKPLERPLVPDPAGFNQFLALAE